MMGGDASRFIVLPLHAAPEAGGADAEMAVARKAEALERVRAFSLRNATCHNPDERAQLIEVIASGCGGHQAFERMLRTLLERALAGRSKSFRRPSASMRKSSFDGFSMLRKSSSTLSLGSASSVSRSEQLQSV